MPGRSSPLVAMASWRSRHRLVRPESKLSRMADTRTPEQRSRIMSAVRHRDTGPEVDLRRSLHARGIRGWRCDYGGVPGRPDLAWPALRLAVFVDGAFWHGHPSRHRPGRSGRYWDEKIEQNVARDRRVDADLEARGWRVLRFWDFQVRRERQAIVGLIVEALKELVDLNSDGDAAWRRAL